LNPEWWGSPLGKKKYGTEWSVTRGNIIIIIIIIIERPHNINSAHMECDRSDTTNSRGDWNHLKIAQTIPEQYTRKA
jgi:hypothetical protein